MREEDKMKENEIRPKNIFERFLQLAKEDIDTFFSNNEDFVHISCPACDKDEANFQFEKHDFSYVLCNFCNTLYVNPRPCRESISEYYAHSKSTKYWSEHFYKDTEEQRREKMFMPMAEFIKELIDKKFNGKVAVFADIGAGFGTFLEEIRDLEGADEIIAIEPSEDLAKICKDKGFNVIKSTLEEANKNLKNKVTFATSFELFEHLYSPKDFLLGVRNILSKGGYLLFTTLNINGFDLQVLWEKSDSISPPHHLNFFNLDSAEILLKRSGFEVVSKSTPGKLDLDIVKNNYREKDIEIGRFLRYLIEKTEDKVQSEFQTFLQKNNLSSHMRIIAKSN